MKTKRMFLAAAALSLLLSGCGAVNVIRRKQK